MRDTQNFINKANSLEYGVWYAMIKRCYDPKNNAYKNYGGRGIVVCESWLGSNGFDNFIKDMGYRPSNDLCIDRIDNDGPYSLENCRWTTRKVQARNRRTNRILTINNQSKSLAEWAEIASINAKTVQDRLDAGWPAELAVFTATRKKVSINIGDKYSKWTVISSVLLKAKDGSASCSVRCDCGTISNVKVYDLKNGKTKRCKACSMKAINIAHL